MTKFIRFFFIFCVFFTSLGEICASPREVVSTSIQDARKLPVGIKEFTRYFDISVIPLAERVEFVKTLELHINEIKPVGEEVVRFRIIDGNVLAVYLHDLNWNVNVWEKLAEVEPWYTVQTITIVKVLQTKMDDGRIFYRFSPKDDWVISTKWEGAKEKIIKTPAIPNDGRYDVKEMAELQLLTHSKVPIVAADWFLIQTSRQLDLRNQQTGAGYYDFLGIKDRNTFEKLIKLNVKDSLEFGFDLQFAMDRSGVGQHGRQGDRFKALGGGAWKTRDPNRPDDTSNPIRLLRREDYKHVAERHFALKADGLFIFLLCTDQGVRQDTAPDNAVGPDDSPGRLPGMDGRIHVGLCTHCHTEGLKPIDDVIRETQRLPNILKSVDPLVAQQLRRRYSTDLQYYLDEDNKIYANGIKRINGRTIKENSVAARTAYHNYVHKAYAIEDIAFRMGVDAKKLFAALEEAGDEKKGRQIDIVLSLLLARKPRPLRIEHVEELVSELWKIYTLYGK